jgi:hypothetical protein
VLYYDTLTGLDGSLEITDNSRGRYLDDRRIRMLTMLEVCNNRGERHKPTYFRLYGQFLSRLILINICRIWRYNDYSMAS